MVYDKDCKKELQEIKIILTEILERLPEKEPIKDYSKAWRELSSSQRNTFMKL